MKKPKQKSLNQEEFFKLYDSFLKETSTGKRLKKNGKRIRLSSLSNYSYCRNLLEKFSTAKGFELKLFHTKNLTAKEMTQAKKYWKKFYIQFTNYMFNDLNCFDNYVGTIIKALKAFLNYLNEELNLSIGNFHMQFYATREEIQIVVLSPRLD